MMVVDATMRGVLFRCEVVKVAPAEWTPCAYATDAPGITTCQGIDHLVGSCPAWRHNGTSSFSIRYKLCNRLAVMTRHV